MSEFKQITYNTIFKMLNIFNTYDIPDKIIIHIIRDC